MTKVFITGIQYTQQGVIINRTDWYAVPGSCPGPHTNYPVYYNPLLSVLDASYKTLSTDLRHTYAKISFTKTCPSEPKFGVDQLNQTEKATAASSLRAIRGCQRFGVLRDHAGAEYNTNIIFNS